MASLTSLADWMGVHWAHCKFFDAMAAAGAKVTPRKICLGTHLASRVRSKCARPGAII